jgi:deoxyadenosine/deoxycytidine kinase
MGKLISVVGNLGAGKTTLTRILCDQGGFTPYWEIPEEHLFSANFAEDHPRWALANQMDFFLFRCQQELTARQMDTNALMDGGLDQDFHVFTRHILNLGYLTPAEYNVCERFYRVARQLLPAPELIIHVIVDIPTLLNRRLARGRQTVDQGFTAQELTDLESLIDEWLVARCSTPVIRFPFTQDFQDCAEGIDRLIGQINSLLQAE